MQIEAIVRRWPRADIASSSAVPKVVYHRLLILESGERRLKCPILLLPRNWRSGQPRRQPLRPSNSRYSDLHSPSSLLVYPMLLVRLRELGAADRMAGRCRDCRAFSLVGLIDSFEVSPYRGHARG
jgi:hypothetical protein